MKKLISISVLTIVILTGLSSCKKDDNSSSTPTSVLNSTVQEGKWKITLYNDSGNDETSHYSGYSFQFSSGGTVTAAKSGGTASGSWSTGNDDDQLKLILNFGTTVTFQELNNDWHVTEQNSSVIKLEDVSGGNGGTDYLTFEKI